MGKGLTVGKRARLVEFDIIKCLAIFFVLWGHSILHLSSETATDNPLYVFISSFHMPLFMLVAGFFSVSSLELPLGKLFSKKFFQLLYPCITFGILFYLVDMLCFGFENTRIDMVYTFWFLKSCFLCYFLFYFSLRLFRGKKWPGVILALLISQLVPVFKINWMLPFFITGYILSGNYDYIKRFKVAIWTVSLIAFAALLLVYDKEMMTGLTGLKNDIMSGNFRILLDLVYVQLYRYFIGIAGSLFIMTSVLLLERLYNKKNFLTDTLNSYGRETLGIYILQTLVLETILSHLVDLREVDVLLFSYLVAPIASLGVMILCMWLLRLIQSRKRINDLFFCDHPSALRGVCRLCRKD